MASTKVQRIMTQPINLIFRFLQSKARIQIWLFEQKDLRIEGRIIVYSSGGSSWVLDSGCINHMTGEEDMFHSLQLTQEAQEIVFGDSDKSKVIGIGKIHISDQQSLSNVLLVDSLSYNLMSVSQLCGMGYNCLFSDVDVKILR
uniref:Retrovirus-related Pol polyprotein from transposon TNT 1-94-like beta-barrel domain-containing protein n=1 Tax=Zea mays TaxID=4577 RepID=C4IYX9_MAIZE|nr:unknown [Zea mays]